MSQDADRYSCFSSIPNLTAGFYVPEETAVKSLITHYPFDAQERAHLEESVTHVFKQILLQDLNPSLVNSLLNHYPLSSKEGMSLMSLTEALLRIPDHKTASDFLEDRFQKIDFKSRTPSQGFMETVASYSIRLTAQILSDKNLHYDSKDRTLWSIRSFVKKTFSTAGVRPAKYLIKRLAGQFVLAENMSQALKKTSKESKDTFTYSYDMLGEAAETAEDAEKYYKAYGHAIDRLGQARQQKSNTCDSISVKLSALYPNFNIRHHQQAIHKISEKLSALATQAKKYDLSLTVDAEETHTAELSLVIFQNVRCLNQLKGWDGFGYAVQAYHKSALKVISFLCQLAGKVGCRIPVRLVKGAYWDTEIKQAQIHGLSEYPVYTRKASTDISYMVCADLMLAHVDRIDPAFATHNLYSIEAIRQLCTKRNIDLNQIEFQALHGMGKDIYDRLKKIHADLKIRIYAPIGSHSDLLPYLVRRLLENGANSSFINHFYKKTLSTTVLNDPVHQLENASYRHDQISLPKDLYGKRQNSKGKNLADVLFLKHFEGLFLNKDALQLEKFPHKSFSTINNGAFENLLCHLSKGQKIWQSTWSVKDRAKIINRLADLMEEHQDQLLFLLADEAGKVVADAVDEIREAVDFCRYYAEQAVNIQSTAVNLHGPTGESNTLQLQGRGIFVCISPWNFPLAIFTGQIVAALVTGNAVIAKPASQTHKIANLAINLMYQAGVPEDVLCCVQCSGEDLSRFLLSSNAINGVCFTGSTHTAWHINQQLARRTAPIIPLIAETGGQNVMMVDSTALHEQVVQDVIVSAFHSAGQRCSALRILLLQDEVYAPVTKMIKGAMAELCIGDPTKTDTDVGPVIDHKAYQALMNHIESMKNNGHKICYQCSLDETVIHRKHYVPPTLIEIKEITDLRGEVFGPILHVMPFKIKNIDSIITQINDLGYGLTFGIQTRIQSRIHKLAQNLKVGNIYANRSMVGAVVESQPFGGMGLSGTGPKAGGPNYLMRFVEEQSVSINTTAYGGNASLMMLMP